VNKQVTVQTLILAKETFPTAADAIKWVTDHDFKVKDGAPDETESSWRYRQREPGEFQEGTFRTIDMTDGVQAVVGRLKEEKMRRNEESVARGNALLLPLNLSVDNVHDLEFAVDKFRQASAARAWAENHGMVPREVKVRADAIFAEILPADAFVFATLRREKVTRDVFAVVGDRVAEINALHVVPDADASMEEKRDVQEVDDPSPVRKRAELHVLKAKDAADPMAEVRMFGIVMKPDVPDIEGDVTSVEEIIQANDLFMREFGTVGFMHKKDVTEKVSIIQNVIAPIDFDFPIDDGGSKSIGKGTWYQELYTADAELVKRIRERKLNGLSIGGFARRVSVDGEGEVQEAVGKRSPEHLGKAEGDTPKSRFVNLRVEEVSIVDAAANEEEFFIIKRRKDMSTNQETQMAVALVEQVGAVILPVTPTSPVVPVAAAAPAAVTPPTPAVTPPTPAVTPPTPAVPVSEPVDVAKAVQSAVSSAVEKGIAPIVERLDAVEKRLSEQATIRAAAKGESVPETTARPAEAPAQKSKWAGTAVHNVVSRAQQRKPA